ncbi:Alpha/beta hydrolase fold-1 [Nemania diffusa]|nr:Alpha/beta hydrolase fold-1 [Nemania diffusa]
MTIQPVSKPIIILIHGAWHTPDAWHKVKFRLEAVGYEVYAPKSLTTAESEPLNCSWRVDAAAIHDLVIPLFNQGRKAVIVGHSYGGIVAAASVEGQSVADRESRGLSGGFSALVYICAFAMPQRGLSIFSMIGGKSPEWIVPAENIPNSINVVPQLTPFYNDLSPDEATEWIGKLQNQSQRTFEEPVEFCANDINIPMTYLICEGDKAIPLQLQELMTSAIPRMKTRRCQAGHSPFLSQPGLTAEVIIDAARNAS